MSDSRPFRDNPLLILVGIALLLATFVALIWLPNYSAQLSPDFLSYSVLWGLSVIVLMMLVALAFVLARCFIKLWVEHRRAVPFARFRTKLVAAMLASALIPAVLVLIVGSSVILNSVDRWFGAPIDEALASANELAGDYHHDRQMAVASHAGRLADALATVDLATAERRTVRDLVARDVTAQRVGKIEVYRVVQGDGERTDVAPLVAVTAPSWSRMSSSAAADRLAAQVVAGSDELRVSEPLDDGSELVRAAAVIRSSGEGPVTGVVVASDHLTRDVVRDLRRITDAYEAYTQPRALRLQLQGVYLSFFLMVTLFILFGATWLGIYTAKRITRPVQMLANGAREIGAGHFDYRIEQESVDEFGSLVAAFNTMAGELSTNRRQLKRSRVDLERKHQEVDGRRRYIETILERIATGVVSIDSTGRVSTINAAATRLLDLTPSVIGQVARGVFERPDLQPLGALLRGVVPGSTERQAQEVALVRDGRERYLAVAVTALPPDAGSPVGTVMVFDDVTPLIRAQRVATWRDVARRLAHEIKNPLTPIQLCAERLRRHFAGAPPRAKALVDECTGTIVGEVESLKALVDEFSHFARMPSPRTVSVDLNPLLHDTLLLYDGLFDQIRIERVLAQRLPPVKIDPEQIRRVVINLVDNAVDVLDGAARGVRGNGPGVISLETQHDASRGVVRLIVADNGPGIGPADRDKLFLPYFSTKRRGSGLGLAIVRRIVAEHGGSIEVSDNSPRGTKFAVELPV